LGLLGGGFQKRGGGGIKREGGFLGNKQKCGAGEKRESNVGMSGGFNWKTGNFWMRNGGQGSYRGSGLASVSPEMKGSGAERLGGVALGVQ